jgi:tetratricopeptide (TPR) repeat protein
MSPVKTCVLILIVGLSFGCSRSPQARRDSFVAKGRSFVQKRDYSRALLEFKNAVRVMPDDAETYYELGKVYAATQDWQSALLSFRKATELNPKHTQAQLRLAQILSLTDDKQMWQDARSRLRALAEGPGANIETLNTLAFTELKLGSAASAVKLLERALSDSPGELSASLLLAQTKLSQNDKKGAEEVLLKACTEKPKAAEPQRYLAEFYIATGMMQQAMERLQQALVLEPNSEASLVDLARLQLTMGRKPEAEQNFKRLIAYPKSRPLYGIFLFQEGRRDEAIREFERVANEDPADRTARTRLVVAYRMMNRPADASQVLQKALKKNPHDADALLQRGEVFLFERKLEQAENDINRVLKLMPTAGEVHYLLGRVYQAQGRSPVYRQELAKALELNPALLAVRLELAQALSQTNEARAAIDLLAEAPESQRAAPPLLVQRNWILWNLGDLQEMRKGIDQGLAVERSPDLLIQDGLWKLRAGNNPQGARVSIEEALKINPADLRALEALHKTYVIEKKGSLALQKIKEYAQKQPGSAPVQDFLGLLLMANGDAAQARIAFTTAKQLEPGFLGVDLPLVQVDVAEGKLDSARQRLEAILVSDKGNLTARRWIGNIEAMRGDMNKAIEHFQQVVASDPNDAQAANNLAYLLTEYRNDNDMALKYAQKAVELEPATPEFSDTLGWVLYRKGLYDPAIKYLERASSNPRNVVWKYHLAMAYTKGGDPQRGRTTLEAALKINANVPEAKAAKELLQVSR